jgi:nickel-dependent lactate racemase
MQMTLTYGNEQTCRADLPAGDRLAAAGGGHAGLADPAAAVRQALREPRGFPPLDLATTPGDAVAIALADGVPEVESVVSGAVAALMSAGVEPAHVTIVAELAIAGRDRLEQRLAEIGAGEVRFQVHDPDDEASIAMVGVTSQGQPLRINRTIAEADFILPIALSESGEAGGVRPKFAGLYPRFGSQETIVRMRPHGAGESAKQRRKRADEIDDAGWKLGVGLVVGIVPASGGGVAEVLAGDPAIVAEAVSARVSELWQRPQVERGDLVIAAIVGDQREQTWSNLARALKAAEPVLADDGVVVVYSELAEPPPGPFELLFEAVDFDEVARELSQDAHADAQAAIVLARALERGPVYLRSQLSADVVESLGMAPIDSDEELSRLAAGRRRCVLIEQAQRLVPTLQERAS